MAGGLLNIVSYGNLNVILNGNPKKTFLKPHMQNIRILDCKNLELILEDSVRCD